MKQLLGSIVFALGALLVGCAPKPDPRIAKLEERVEQLESARLEFESRISTNVWQISATLRSNNAVALDFMKSGLSDLRASTVEAARAQVQENIAALSAPAAKRQVQLVAKPKPAMRSGVPVDVYDRIAERASQKWPDNFEMQEFTIKNQIESYLKLNGQMPP